MKKFIYLLFLLPLFGYGQVSDATITTAISTYQAQSSTYTNEKSKIVDIMNKLNLSKINLNQGNALVVGGPNTYAADVNPAITSYAFGQTVKLMIGTQNSGASTINLNSLGAKTIKKQSAGSLVDVVSGDLIANGIYELTYDGTYFQWTGGGSGGGGGGSGTVNSGTANQLTYYAGSGTTVSGLTAITTNRALASDANGLPVATATTAAELAFVNGVTSAIQTQLNAKAPLASPTFTGTVSGITSAMVGLGNVDNTSDINKPVSTATQTALNLKANLASPTFTGIPLAPTAAPGTNTTQIATMAALQAAISAASIPDGDKGDITVSSTGSVWTIDNGAVTAAKIVSAPALTGTNFTGIPESGVTNLTSDLAAKQATLISGTNIKTVSGASLLGSGDLGTIDVAHGGTGVTVSSGASSVVLRDANQNVTANNSLLGYTTTATAAGTTTLTVSSSKVQFWTGTTTQTVLMPVVSTLALNHEFSFTNNSTSAVTVQSSGANSIQIMAPGSTMKIRNISTSGTTASSWSWEYNPINPMVALGDLPVGNATGEPTRLAIGTERQILSVVSSALAWNTGIVGTITNDNAAALSVGEFTSSLIAVGSATSLTTATAKNVTSISLTAGDWDVSGNINFTEGSATVTTRTAGISSTSATQPTDGSEIEMGITTTVLSTKIGIAVPRKRFSLSATTTVYLVATSTFSAGTSAAYGSITARRVR